MPDVVIGIWQLMGILAGIGGSVALHKIGITVFPDSTLKLLQPESFIGSKQELPNL
jgi:hypothetical protein